MRIVHLSDAHISREPARYLPGVDLKQRCAAALAAALALDPAPDLCVLGGDMLDEGPVPDYGTLSALFERAGRPVHLCLGNHDSREAYAARPLPSAPAGNPGYYSFDSGGLHVVILFTAAERRGKGSLDSLQLDWLRDDLQRSAPSPCLVFMHHPPVDVGVPWLDAIKLEDPGPFWRAITPAAPRIEAVLFAHIHFAVTMRVGGVLLASAPAVGWQFRADPGAAKAETTDEAPGFNVIDSWAGGLSVRTVRFSAPSGTGVTHRS